MIQEEKQIKKDIVQLFTDLEVATYGCEKANGHYLSPNASSFYWCAKRIFELTDELVKEYQPIYISGIEYKFIYDSRKRLLLELDVLKDKKQANEIELTYKLEEYLTKMQGLFKCIIE